MAELNNNNIEIFYIIDPENQQKVFDANIPFFLIEYDEIWHVVGMVVDNESRDDFFAITANDTTLDFEIALREPSFGGVPALVSNAPIIKTLLQ